MVTKFGSYRMLFVVSLTLILVSTLLYLMISFSWQQYQEYDEKIRQIEPKISRLLGIEHSRDRLEKSNNDVQSQLALLTYSAENSPAMIGAAMQQKVREAMRLSNMSVSGSQILPVKVSDGYDKISLNVTAKGTIESFKDILLELKKLQPGVVVESVNIKPVKSNRNEPSKQQVSVRFKLLSLRLQE